MRGSAPLSITTSTLRSPRSLSERRAHRGGDTQRRIECAERRWRKTQPRAAELAPRRFDESTLPGVPAPPISGRKTAIAAGPGLRPQNTDGTRIAAADTIHCELRYSKSARQAEVGTIRAAIADSHPDKRKPAK